MGARCEIGRGFGLRDPVWPPHITCKVEVTAGIPAPAGSAPCRAGLDVCLALLLPTLPCLGSFGPVPPNTVHGGWRHCAGKG